MLFRSQVQSAANSMRSAAEEMQRAASAMDYTMERQRQFMDDWLFRLEAALEKATIARSQS